ncbi:MAG: hypothetical protein KYX68_08650, partial [Flavobacterium sp.]|nr:hypothetical protein [Flavobacterium sp.]
MKKLLKLETKFQEKNHNITYTNQMIKKILPLFFSLFFVFSFGQEIEKKWQLSSSNGDFLELKEGSYNLKLSNDSISQNGDYLVQDNFLFLFENGSDSPTKRFRIETKTDSTLTLKKGEKAYSFFSSNKVKKETKSSELIPNQCLTDLGLGRGVLGMICLLAVAFLFSSNRKAINWKT